MDHFSTQMGQRFLAKALDHQKLMAATQHLRECQSCRDNIIALRRSRQDSLLEQILPVTLTEEHPSQDLLAAFVDNDLTPPDRGFIENHVAACNICRDVLSDLRAFQDELKQMPAKQHAPVRTSLPRPLSYATRESASEDRFPYWLRWLMQPFGLGLAFAAAASLVLIAFVSLTRSPQQQLVSQAMVDRPANEFDLLDNNHQIRFDSNGIINPAPTLPQADLEAVNRICVVLLRNEPLPASPALASLRSVTTVLRGQRSEPALPVKLIRPVRTLIKPGRATFQWTTVASPQSYTVHVVDDETQEEVATSEPISPAPNASICEWSEQQLLPPGKRYRWYVAAVLDDQEIDAPAAEDPPAKFSVLSEENLAQVNQLEKANLDDELINGLIDLRVGLLDDAEANFNALLEEPGQTLEGKAFLRNLIEGTEKLRTTP